LVGTTPAYESKPAVAANTEGDFVVAWQTYVGGDSDGDIAARHFLSDGSADGAQFQVNTTTESDQDTPTVALRPDGTFVVAWGSAYQDGDDSGVFAQRFNSPPTTTTRTTTSTSSTRTTVTTRLPTTTLPKAA